VISSVGLWAQPVGAQWLFVDNPNVATIVTLVQTATTLPMMLLAMPAGVLADAFDRRRLMLGVQTYSLVVAGAHPETRSSCGHRTGDDSWHRCRGGLR
jgi:MFS family permease